MERKIDILKHFMETEDWRSALCLASTFARLGKERAAIIRGHEAYSNPRFWQSLHKDPDNLISEGIAALKARYR